MLNDLRGCSRKASEAVRVALRAEFGTSDAGTQSAAPSSAGLGAGRRVLEAFGRDFLGLEKWCHRAPLW